VKRRAIDSNEAANNFQGKRYSCRDEMFGHLYSGGDTEILQCDLCPFQVSKLLLHASNVALPT